MDDPTGWTKYIENFGVSLVMLIVLVFSALRATRWMADKILVPTVSALIDYLGENTKAIKSIDSSQKELQSIIKNIDRKTDEIHREVLKK